MAKIEDFFTNPQMCKFKHTWPYSKFKKAYSKSVILVRLKMSIEELFVALWGDIEDTKPKPEVVPEVKTKKGSKSD